MDTTVLVIIFLIGRLSRDPELRHTTNGTAVCQINVASNKPEKTNLNIMSVFSCLISL